MSEELQLDNLELEPFHQLKPKQPTYGINFHNQTLVALDGYLITDIYSMLKYVRKYLFGNIDRILNNVEYLVNHYLETYKNYLINHHSLFSWFKNVNDPTNAPYYEFVRSCLDIWFLKLKNLIDYGVLFIRSNGLSIHDELAMEYSTVKTSRPKSTKNNSNCLIKLSQEPTIIPIEQNINHNAEVINKDPNEKIICQCEGSYTRKNKLQHFKTQTHIDYL